MGAKSPPVTDPERGGSYKESLEHSDALFCRWNLSDTQGTVDSTVVDSMPPLPQVTDDALPDESWPLRENVGIKPVGAKVDEDTVPENSMPSLEDDGKKTLAVQKQENPGSVDRLPTSCLPQEMQAEHVRTAGMEIPTQSAVTLSFAEGTKVILKGLTALQYGQVCKIFKLHGCINTGQDTSGPGERAQA